MSHMTNASSTGVGAGFTLWLTGLSGAGKSTISDQLIGTLKGRGLRVQLLDGDLVRTDLCRGLGFSKEDRDENIRRIAAVADLLSHNGVAVIVAAISPYRAARDSARERIGRFVEVHVDCSLDELQRRDVKGLYKKALAGEIEHFTGISDPYEEPLQPDVIVDTASQTVEESARAIIARLEEIGYLAPEGVSIAPHGGRLQIRQSEPSRAERLHSQGARMPAVELDLWASTDLEMLAIGALSPLTGFMGSKDVAAVRDNWRLENGLPWPLPIMLTVPQEVAGRVREGESVSLVWEGKTLAVIDVSEVYEYDRERLTEAVYGTLDPSHPGVARMLSRPAWALAGDVHVIARPSLPFGSMCMTPEETRQAFADRGWSRIVGFQTRNPVHRAHEYLLRVALEQVDGLLLHPLLGETKGDDIPQADRILCYEALTSSYLPEQRVLLSGFPASMRYAGPREAVFHALVRKNYGCTHFIVGRDHAGVGSFYGTYEAQQAFDRFAAHEIGIEILRFENAFYCRRCEGMATSHTCSHGDSDRLIMSGTRVREHLANGLHLPPEFTRPEIASILAGRSAAANGNGNGNGSAKVAVR